MCVVQRSGDRGCNMNRFVDGELSFPDQLCAQRFAFDERHYVVQQSGGFAALEQRQQVRMLKVGSNLNFREESLATDHGAELRIHNLDSDPPLMLDVARKVYRRHSARADLLLDSVAIGEYRAQAVEGGHARETSCFAGRVVRPTAADRGYWEALM